MPISFKVWTIISYIFLARRAFCRLMKLETYARRTFCRKIIIERVKYSLRWIDCKTIHYLWNWAFEAACQEVKGMGQDIVAYHPGLYLTPTQREAVEALIQELSNFRLKFPTNCSECPICLEEFMLELRYYFLFIVFHGLLFCSSQDFLLIWRRSMDSLCHRGPYRR